MTETLFLLLLLTDFVASSWFFAWVHDVDYFANLIEADLEAL